jgi:NADH-quinone oxidoreductase subunit F
MNFENILKPAIAEWAALQSSKKPQLLVGAGTCGQAAGALEIIKTLETELKKEKIDAIMTRVGCLGPCYAEPLVGIIKPGKPQVLYGNLTPEITVQLVKDYLVGDNPRPDLAFGTIGEGTIKDVPQLFELPSFKPQVRIILRHCGLIDPENINHYIANKGYSGLARALAMKPDDIIQEIRRSGLRGRGGAGFSTAQKWEFCRRSPGDQKYIICNADEGDPGAFMNRSLLEGNPHLLLEGMLIGAYAIGAGDGYIYCRAEYPLAIERLNIAIARMEKLNLIGDNILGSGFSFHLKIKEGAGAFVCGEETALMASIEGERGMPRPRPPFPAVAGLWGKPTNINNVETWASTSLIMQNDAEWYARNGSEKSKGTKTFALVGKIARSGLIEVPLGIKLRQIIYDIGGGILNGKDFKAVQTGGPSGGCLPPSLLDSPVDYESLAAAGSIMGSGGMIVADQDTCMVDLTRYFLSFTQAESCGKCTPCRVGTRLMLEKLVNITRGQGKPGDLEELLRLSNTVKQGSLCGLGQTAPNPVLTAIRYFKDEFEAHINDKICPAKVCKDLINFKILPDECQGCGICARECPVQAIKGGKRMVHVIDQAMCIKCGTCLEKCPEKFKAVRKLSGETVETPAEPIPVKAAK